jgi:hypothetical protein
MAESHFPRPPLAEIKVSASDERRRDCGGSAHFSLSCGPYPKEMERR